MAWTEAQISALAPDAASLKAGRGLAVPAKWSNLGENGVALWGACQGSGSKPYQTQIDLREPAFKCSCPSRKFPCKHGLGLFLLSLQSPPAAAEPPEWVQTWLSSREARGEAKEKKQALQSAQASEPQALSKTSAKTQAKTQAQRAARAEAGLAELEQWLQDLLRRGLVTLRQASYGFYDQVAARMVDAQMPGLARRLRQLATLSPAAPDWAEQLLTEFGLMYLLISGYRQRAHLSVELLAELETQLGWTASQSAVADQPGQAERWWVSGISQGQENALRLQRIWLWGQNSGDCAMLLDFAFGPTPFKYPLLVGESLQGEVSWFAGSGQRRGLLKPGYTRFEPCSLPPELGWPDLSAVAAQQRAHLAANPWSRTGGAWLQALRPHYHQQTLYLEDPKGQYLPVGSAFQQTWDLLALSAGHFLPTFVEWEGPFLYPLSVLTETGLHALACQRDRF